MDNILTQRSQTVALVTQSQVTYPLLVKVQSIDIQKLEFKNGAPRNKHVTCIEASNQFLFLGCISGTVYVFSRKDLEFLFIIPFKGGKVCNISSSENEDDVAIGSVRGIVSVFRISPNTLLPESRATTTTSSLLKHLCTVSNHSQLEITEILWSPNGRFLFIGDNQGLISQVDVGTFDELSDNILSKVILKLKTRIIQLSFIFPYLAVSALGGVYLCDIENEQFTRIQVQPKIDLKSTGVCLIHLKNSTADTCEPSLSSLHLFVGEANTGYLHSFDMEGIKVASRLVNMSSAAVAQPIKLFDPICLGGDQVQVVKSHERPESYQVLGKLFVTDDGYIVSTCRDHGIYIVETSEMQLVLWSEDFHRINSLKILSNYMFVGSGSHMIIVSLTQFRLYGEQLLKSKLVDVLHRWIQHTISAMGCHPGHCNENCTIDCSKCQCRNRESKELFQKFVGKFVVDDELSLLVTRQLPFRLEEEISVKPKSSPKSKVINLFILPLKSFVEKLQLLSTELKNNDLQNRTVYDFIKDISEIFESLARIYEVQILLPLCYFDQNLLLSEVLNSASEFYKQTKDFLIGENFRNALSQTISENLFNQLIKDYILKLKEYQSSSFIYSESWTLINHKIPMFFNFTKFAHQKSTQDWFSSVYIESNEFYDAILSDAIILLMPLVSSDLQLQIWSDIKPTGFFSWLVYLKFYNNEMDNSQEHLLSSLFSERRTDPNCRDDIISLIYRDFLGSDLSPLAKILHHIISAIHFTSNIRNCNKSETLKLLLACFPLKHWTDTEIQLNIYNACNENQKLLNMLKVAILSDGQSISICSCGFPSRIHAELLANYFKPRIQRIVEKIILKILIQNYDSKLPKSSMEQLCCKSGFQFAMQRSLFETYLSDPLPLLENTEEVRIEIILRTNLCTLLQKLKVTKYTINTLIRRRSELTCQNCCISCGEVISPIRKHFLLDDCIGLWILNSCNNTKKALHLFQKSNLNSPGQFSMKFYQIALACNLKPRKVSTSDVTHENIYCSPVHGLCKDT